MIVCEGCGGRNPDAATECEWCARPFRGANGGGPPRRPILIALVVALILIIGLGLAALTLTNPPPGAQHVLATPTPLPLDTSTPPAGQRTPLPRSGEVVITNTEGQGASLRREPSSKSERITVLIEGTRVRVVGPEVLEEDSAWVEVQDAQDERGWVQSNFVSMPDASRATPTPTSGPE